MGERAGTGEVAVIPARQVAKLMGKSCGWFYAHKDELERAGFPKRDDLLGGWPAARVDGWLARRTGFGSTSPSAGKERLRRAIDARKDAVRNAAH